LFKPCANGDFFFLWENQKFDSHRIKTPDLIEIWHDCLRRLDDPSRKISSKSAQEGLLGK